MDLDAFYEMIQIPGKRVRLNPVQKRLAKMLDDAVEESKKTGKPARMIMFRGRPQFVRKEHNA